MVQRLVSFGIVSFFRNTIRNSEEQLAYADYYRKEEEAATAQQMELVRFYLT